MLLACKNFLPKRSGVRGQTRKRNEGLVRAILNIRRRDLPKRKISNQARKIAGDPTDFKKNIGKHRGKEGHDDERKGGPVSLH